MSVLTRLENVHDLYLSLFLETLSHIASLSLNIFPLLFHRLLDRLLLFDISRDTHSDRSIPLHCGSSLPARSSFNLTLLSAQQAAGNAIFLIIEHYF